MLASVGACWQAALRARELDSSTAPASCEAVCGARHDGRRGGLGSRVVIGAPDIPGHTVTGVLGSGGFATVYRAWQLAVGRETAVKVDSRVLHTERDRRRFVREVTAAGRLSGHPHVVDAYDAGILRDGRPYLVMELCPGGSLDAQLRRRGPMSAAMVCRIGAGLADALAAAHAEGILHRDIKPANILVNRYGVVGLSDFGLASIIAATGEQSVSREALTPAYAPPETFQAAEPTEAADLYSLAATLYALMTGRPPRFPADSRSPGLATILALHDQPIDDIPGAPPELLAVLRQCLAADPARRLPSAASLRDSLAALSGQAGGPARTALAAEGPLLAHATGSSAAYASPSRAAAPPAVGGQRTEPPAQVAAVTSPPAQRIADTGRPGRGAHAATQGRRSRLAPLAAAAGLIVVVAAALVVGARLLAHGGGPARTGNGRAAGPVGSIGSFGIATTTAHCPAASVPAAGARCPSSPECWDGLVETEGVITASSLPCAGPHSWQTFAIAIMPAGASTFNVNIVQANKVVRSVCSYQVLLASRAGRARLFAPSRWSIQVVPPDEAAYNSGVRTYRCLASLGYGRSLTSQFGP